MAVEFFEEFIRWLRCNVVYSKPVLTTNHNIVIIVSLLPKKVNKIAISLENIDEQD